MSVLMGVPLGICKNEVSTPLPAFPSSPHMAATVAIHVKLFQALNEISNSEIPPHFVQASVNANVVLHSDPWARRSSNESHIREEKAKCAQRCYRCGF